MALNQNYVDYSQGSFFFFSKILMIVGPGYYLSSVGGYVICSSLVSNFSVMPVDLRFYSFKQ